MALDIYDAHKYTALKGKHCCCFREERISFSLTPIGFIGSSNHMSSFERSLNGTMRPSDTSGVVNLSRGQYSEMLSDITTAIVNIESTLQSVGIAVKQPLADEGVEFLNLPTAAPDGAIEEVVFLDAATANDTSNQRGRSRRKSLPSAVGSTAATRPKQTRSNSSSAQYQQQRKFARANSGTSQPDVDGLHEKMKELEDMRSGMGGKRQAGSGGALKPGHYTTSVGVVAGWRDRQHYISSSANPAGNRVRSHTLQGGTVQHNQQSNMSTLFREMASRSALPRDKRPPMKF